MNRGPFDGNSDVIEPPSDIERVIQGYETEDVEREAQELLGALVQEGQYVGEVFSLGYETALVQIHDSHRKQVGGIPSLSFLIATRLIPGQKFDYTEEDSCALLFRVMDAAPLPNDDEAIRVRVQAARQVAGPDQGNWDDSSVMDFHTAGLLGFAGVRCRVIGTFYLDQAEAGNQNRLRLQFGTDISNYYPNRGLKVYKPNGEALRSIVNYREEESAGVGIGEVRYASTSRSFQGIRDVRVTIVPEDLLGQKSALFGMTRTGKSNTTKIIAKAVFDLRYHTESPRRVGQIIFDPNGEYANANAQDAGGEAPNALKNVWRAHHDGVEEDVATYGITSHPNDPNRRLMLINFYDDETLGVGKEAIDGVLSGESSIYFRNFMQVRIGPVPASSDRGSGATRAWRRILAYRALLAGAGFALPSFAPQTQGLFNQELLKAMSESQSPDAADYQQGATILRLPNPTWDQLATAMKHLDAFIHDGKSEYSQFNNWYMNQRPNASGDPWADEDFKKIIRMFHYANGPRRIADARPMHTNEVGTDYAEDIYQALVQGRLVIVDQSSGDELINQTSARRVVQRIFDGNKEEFRQGKPKEEIPDILIYAEEAHNLLPSDRETDYRDIWVRTAKEGAKYNLGLIYVTQEVSSIQRNILKNTANWFIGHLNNTDETRELKKFYDFADFERSILRAQDKGFLRVKTISDPFVVPVQVREFELRFAPGKEPIETTRGA